MGVARVDFEATQQMWAMQGRHALSIGELCITWAALDGVVDSLLEPMLEAAPAQIASIVTNIENISSRCDILRRLLVHEAPSEPYRAWLSALLNRVSGELSPLRNRYIHDSWSVTNLKILRRDKRAKIEKPQSRQPQKLLFDTEHVTDPKDVEKLTLRTTLVLMMLNFAKYDLDVWRQTGRCLEPHPQYIEASKPNARYRSPQEHEEAHQQGPVTSDFVFD